MIISRTPFRVSFFGGGTDYPVWYKDHGGVVLSSTIDKYCYVTLRELPPFFKYKHLLRYYQREEANSIEEIEHPSIRECLKFLNMNKNIELVHHADLPARSGLGSSSTFTVGLLMAGYALNNQMITKNQLAQDAIEVEQHRIGESVGSQDQTAASFGGLNRINFGGYREVNVTPLTVSLEKVNNLQNHLMLFFTGFSRNAADIARKQIEISSIKTKELNIMVELCQEAEKLLVSSDDGFLEWGELLNEQWKIKKSMTNLVTNSKIDEMYDEGIKSGALGGKLLGAGGGGFILFFVPPEKQKQLTENLKDFLHVPFKFDFTGSQIVYHSKNA
jgi:D-glycero-alpha-D-manno-heptose-7-phosphate kinase